MKKLITFCCLLVITIQITGQTTAEEVVNMARKANDYFMQNLCGNDQIHDRCLVTA